MGTIIEHDILIDNKRLQDRIKEAEGIMKMVDKL